MREQTEHITTRKKILFMIDTLRGGGAEKVLIYILKEIDRTKFEVDLFLTIKDGIYTGQVPADIACLWILKTTDDIAFLPYKYLYRTYRRTMLELFKIFPSLLSRMSGIKKTYDIGISFCEGYNTPLLALKAPYFKKTIAWVHVDMRTHPFAIGSKRFYRCTRQCDRIYFVSQEAKNGFIALFPELKSDQSLEVVYNPIDCQTILKEAEQSATIQKDKLVVLAIGRLTAQKRFDKLLNVHKRLLDQGIDHHIWILGVGPDENMLKKQAEKLKITQSCLFLGFQNPYPYLKSADVFVMTSDYEGLPLVVCEAMIFAKPIVSTAVTGPTELLEGGRYGLLVDTAEAAIEKGLSGMLQNQALREDYSSRLINGRGKFIFPADVKDIEKKLLLL